MQPTLAIELINSMYRLEELNSSSDQIFQLDESFLEVSGWTPKLLVVWVVKRNAFSRPSDDVVSGIQTLLEAGLEQMADVRGPELSSVMSIICRWTSVPGSGARLNHSLMRVLFHELQYRLLQMNPGNIANMLFQLARAGFRPQLAPLLLFREYAITSLDTFDPKYTIHLFRALDIFEELDAKSFRRIAHRLVELLPFLSWGDFSSLLKLFKMTRTDVIKFDVLTPALLFEKMNALLEMSEPGQCYDLEKILRLCIELRWEVPVYFLNNIDAALAHDLIPHSERAEVEAVLELFVPQPE